MYLRLCRCGGIWGPKQQQLGFAYDEQAEALGKRGRSERVALDPFGCRAAPVSGTRHEVPRLNAPSQAIWILSCRTKSSTSPAAGARRAPCESQGFRFETIGEAL